MKLLLSIIAIMFAINTAFSQGAAINTSGSAADPSAMLDVSGTDKGVLITRMTTAERDLIASPANGLLIFNIDCNVLNYNAGTPAAPDWVTVSASNTVPASVSITANPAGSICPGDNITFTATPVSGGTAPSYQWKNNGSDISGETNVSFSSTSLINGDAISCVMTSNQNCVSGSPATSNIINISITPMPAAPLATAGSGTTPGQMTANWNIVSGANGYYLDVATDNGFSTYVPGYIAYDISNGSTTSHLVTGLSGSTTFYYRVRAYGDCGTSGNSNIISFTTPDPCVAIGGQKYNGYCWIPTGVRATDPEVNCTNFCASIGKTCNSTVMQATTPSQADNIVHLFHPGVDMSSNCGDAPAYQWTNNQGCHYVEAGTCTHNDNVLGRERYCVCTPEP